jgi:PRTRC genetic system protein D
MSNLAHPVVLAAAAVDVGFFATKFSLGRDRASGHIAVDHFISEAVPVPGGINALPFAQRPDGFIVDVDGAPYFVGKGAADVGTAFGTRAVSADYSRNPTYRAIFLGALAYMAKHYCATTSMEIKQLVVGLPMSTFASHAAELQAMVEGNHSVPASGNTGAISVVVHSAHVAPQPMGAMMNAGLGLGRKSSPDSTLILDMGGGTFDWFTCNGLAPKTQRCGAAPVGMLTCAAEICDRIKPGLKSNRDIMNRVDRALRCNEPTVRVAGLDVELKDHLRQVDAVLHRALDEMLKSVGTLDDIGAMHFTGGGAQMLAKVAAVKLKDYAHMIHVDQDPVTSNVRGFHVMGEWLNGTGA